MSVHDRGSIREEIDTTAHLATVARTSVASRWRVTGIPPTAPLDLKAVRFGIARDRAAGALDSRGPEPRGGAPRRGLC